MEKRLRSEGQWQTKNFTQPKLIKMYNSNMRGVDLGDQRIATYSRLMKGNIWYYKIFLHMLAVAVLNAHIMYQGAGHQDVSLGDFKDLLVEQLTGGNSFRWTPYHGMYLKMYQMFVLNGNTSTIQ